MIDTEIIALANELGIEGSAVGFESGRYGSIKETRDHSILAFTRAIEQKARAEQREKDARIREARGEEEGQACANLIRTNKE